MFSSERVVISKSLESAGTLEPGEGSLDDPALLEDDPLSLDPLGDVEPALEGAVDEVLGCPPAALVSGEGLDGGVLVEGADTVVGSEAPLEAHSLETALGRISEPEESPASVPQQQSANEQSQDFLVSLAPYLDSSLDALRWQKLVPGIKQIKLDVGDNELPGSVRLFNIKPGFSLPQHSHNGEELSFVLRGAFTDEFGRYGVGDL